jgi:hypothetical protein
MKKLYFIIGILILATLVNAAYLPHKAVVAYAYISTPDTTITTSADVWYLEQSTYTNSISEQFTIVSDTLSYQNGSGYVVILLTGSVESSSASTKITLGISINGEDPVAGAQNTGFSFRANEPTVIGITYVIYINKGDNISIWIKSDKAGAILTPTTLQTTAFYIGD